MKRSSWSGSLCLSTLSGILALALLPACGDEAGADGSGGSDTTATSDSPCADDSYNPLAGTCAQTFLADCFDPAGECDGQLDPTTYDVTLTWDNGASVETQVDYSDPTSPGATTTIYSSTGDVCATGQTHANYAGCASQTVYTRSSDDAIQIWCVQTDGSMEIVCNGGDAINVTAAQSAAVNECGFSSDAGPCTVTY